MRTVLPIALFALASLLLFVLGYLIKVKKQMNLIAGYSSERVHDKDGLANWVGSGTMLIGGLCVLTGILLSAFPQYVLPVTVSFILVTITSSMVMAIGCNRYTKQIDNRGANETRIRAAR